MFNRPWQDEVIRVDVLVTLFNQGSKVTTLLLTRSQRVIFEICLPPILVVSPPISCILENTDPNHDIRTVRRV